MAEELRHYFTLVPCNPEDTVADINSDDVECLLEVSAITRQKYYTLQTRLIRKNTTHCAPAAQWQ